MSAIHRGVRGADLENEVTLIKINQTVKYESTRTAGRWFKGQVHLVDGDRAVIKHDTEPHYVTVVTQRLTVVPPKTITVHKGRTA